MGKGLAIVVALFGPLGGGCLETPAVQCDGFICPPDQVCDPGGQGCVLPEQLEACEGLAEGDPCIFAGTDGSCTGGVCTGAACGNAVLDGVEQCEPDLPINTDCVTFGLDYGHIHCSEGCALEIGCARLGWLQQPSGTSAFMNSVFGFGANEAYAVGVSGTILRYDGVGWRPMVSQTNRALRGVWGSDPDNVFAVGDLAVSGEGTILHFDGSSWTLMASDGAPRLRGIWGTGPSNVYAVGDIDAGSGEGTILHYDGSAWSQQTSGVGEALFGVWARGPNDVFAVGANGTIIHSSDGVTWSPQQSNSVESLQSISGNATDTFAVGLGGALLRSTDGMSWEQTLIDPGGTNLFAVSANVDTVVAVGRNSVPSGVLFTHNGTNWIVLGNLLAPGLSAVWTDGVGAQFAAGELGLVAQSGGSHWLDGPEVVMDGLSAVWHSDSELFAVGTGGKLAHGDLSGMSEASVGVDDFHDVGGNANNDVVAVGDNGHIVRFDSGLNTLASTIESNQSLRSVWATPGREVAVGDAGTVLVSNGSSWSVECSAAGEASALACAGTADLFGVWGTASETFAVGDLGTISRFDGSAWSSMVSGTINPLRSVWGSAASDVFAVGEAGTVLHFDGAIWSPMLQPSTEDLFAISGSGPSDVFAVGANGSVLHYDGTNWVHVRSLVADTHLDVSVAVSEVYFATGQKMVRHLLRTIPWP